MTKYRIKVTTNVGGITVYVPQKLTTAATKDQPEKWDDINWFRNPVPNKIEAEAAIQMDKDIAIAAESYVPVE